MRRNSKSTASFLDCGGGLNDKEEATEAGRHSLRPEWKWGRAREWRKAVESIIGGTGRHGSQVSVCTLISVMPIATTMQSKFSFLKKRKEKKKQMWVMIIYCNLRDWLLILPKGHRLNKASCVLSTLLITKKEKKNKQTTKQKQRKHRIV